MSHSNINVFSCFGFSSKNKKLKKPAATETAETMPGFNLKNEQKLFVENLKQQGILDDHFDQFLEMRTSDNPELVLEKISMFSNEANNCIKNLTDLLNDHVVDFGDVFIYCHQLRDSSTSIGGRRVAIACRELRVAIDEMNKDRCLEALNRVKEAYQVLKHNLYIISQIERNIIGNEERRRPRNAQP